MMNTLYNYLKGISVAMMAVLTVSCADSPHEERVPASDPGVLRMGVSFDAGTRLAELPNADSMALNINGLGDVGLYV